jgi:GH24 family phage-related lysozyme (muramidase)
MTNSLNQLSDAGSRFIRNFEGFRAFEYSDTGGLITIGYGERVNVGAYPNGITEEQALVLFNQAVDKIIIQLGKLPFAGFMQHQIDAILSLAFNVGYEGFVNSTIYKQLIVRSTDLGAWNWIVRDQKGKIDQGLVNRRRAELKLFIYGLY